MEAANAVTPLRRPPDTRLLDGGKWRESPDGEAFNRMNSVLLDDGLGP
jgi:hypothetical protein